MQLVSSAAATDVPPGSPRTAPDAPDDRRPPVPVDAPDLAALIPDHQHVLIGFATRLTGDRAVAEDVVQEVFLKVWRQQIQLEGPAARAYLMTMVRNRVIDRSRRRTTRLELSVAEMPFSGSTTRDRQPVLDRMVVVDLLRQLPVEHREVLVRIYLREQSITEVAEALGIPAGTVRSRCFYGLRRLRTLSADQADLGSLAG